MTDDEKLIRDIETLKESIEIDRLEIGLAQRTAKEKAEIREHLQHCKTALKELESRIGGTA